jgi:hypothetical protein
MYGEGSAHGRPALVPGTLFLERGSKVEYFVKGRQILAAGFEQSWWAVESCCASKSWRPWC